jgi:hypothetical protein
MSPHTLSKRISLLSTLLLFTLLAACNPYVITPVTNELIADLVTITPLSKSGPYDQRDALLPTETGLPEDLTHYDIQLHIDFEEHAFHGHATVTYTNIEDVPLDSLFFRLYPNGHQTYGNGRLIVTQIKVDGELVESRSSLLDTVLEVKLPRTLEPSTGAQIDLDFAGIVPLDYGGEGNPTGYGIFNFTDDVLTLSGWYPILAVYDHQGWNLDPVFTFGDSVYSDIALYTVEVTYADDLVLIGTGVEVDHQSIGDFTQSIYVSGPARDFVLVASPEFNVLNSQINGIQVNAYYLPGNEGAAQFSLTTSLNALRVFSDLFGQYPYREFDVVEAPMRIASGVEYPGIIFLASRRMDDYDPSYLAVLTAHEVAHQWWYNLIGNDVIQEPWLDESLTTYSSGLYLEQEAGPDAYGSLIDYWWNRYQGALTDDQDDIVTGGMRHFQKSGSGTNYSAIIYDKGALFFHKLRETIGDQAFFDALRYYHADNRYGIATAIDLLESFEATSGLDLDPIFYEWLYSIDGVGKPTPTGTLTPNPTPQPTSTITPTPTPLPLIRFAVVGDYGMDNQAEEDVANTIISWDPDFVITTGDNNYPSGSEETIDAAIGRYYQRFIHPYKGTHGSGADTNRFFPSLGNHDLLSDDGAPYFDYFTLPGNERYYDFNWGPVHFFALNSDPREPDGVGLSSIQASWLRQGLAESTSPWQIVYMHHPPFSSGYHGSTDWAQWPYQEWGADTVIAGHDHTYERLIINGFPYFVNGLGGAGIYNFHNILESSMMRFNADHGAMLVEASPEKIAFHFITRRGTLVDYYEIERK